MLEGPQLAVARPLPVPAPLLPAMAPLLPAMAPLLEPLHGMGALVGL